jgi:N-acetylglucosaminyl-diphospho-decaprenol L-rhamnosyltransferase
MNRLAIVIVSYNTREDLAAALGSLLGAPPSAPHEIVVIDNGSSDGSADMARGLGGVRVIEAGRNLGFGAANNAGIRASEGDLVLLLNSDTLVPAGAIDRLAAELAADPGVAAVGPRLVDAAGRPELSFGRMIGPFAELAQKAMGRLYASRRRWARRWVERRMSAPRDVDWVSAACLLVRRQAAVGAGLFDERYFMYAEDVDFCAALRALGWRVRYAPSAEVVHLRGRSRATRPDATARAYRRSQVAFYEKHHPAWAPWLKLYLRLRGQLPLPGARP